MILQQNRYPKFTLAKKIQVFKEKPLILYSALDWGLGHTIRSITVIRELIRLGCRVIVACNSVQKQVFEKEFPQISYVEIFGYDMNYGHSRASTLLKLFLQGPKFLMKVKAENRWLAAFLEKNKVDGVISDNRYGFYTSLVPSVLITHQLALSSGAGSTVDRIAQQFLYKLINRFAACWVPDAIEYRLAGKLSHPDTLPKTPVHYIGLLTRMQPCADTLKTYRYCFILSGPEPQRTILEKKIIKHLPPDSLLIRGLPADKNNLHLDNATIINYADAKLLNTLICSSETIVCRPGYTSMMELIPMNKKIIVIPTPGQGEQEYLAKYLSASGYVKRVSQNDFTFSSLSQ